MKKASEVTACFVDHGLFLPLAEKLAEKFKRVFYYCPWEEGFSTLRKGAIGDGYETIEKVLDIWEIKNECDLFCFPDIQHAGIQLELESQGFPVWGSKAADSLEINRRKFLRVLGQVGLEVPPHAIVFGITALRDHLRGVEDKYIKISRWRGDLETTHWRNWREDENLLDVWAVKFGGMREEIPFLVFDALPTDIEIGSDTYCVNGEWPSHMLNGIENKDKSYFGVVTPFDEMPQHVTDVLKAFGPVLGSYRYTNQFSTEIRVVDDTPYFIDPTCRAGLPSTPSQMMLWENLADIIWHGANGEIIDPVFSDKFSMEVAITADPDENAWITVELPESIRPYAKLARAAIVDGCHTLPPEPRHGDIVGWLVATGQTPIETLEKLKSYAEELPDGICASVDSLAHVIKEVDSAEEQGVPVTTAKMPKASDVIE